MSRVERWTFDGPPAYQYEKGGYVLYKDYLKGLKEIIEKVRAEYVNENCVWAEGECIPNCPSCKQMDKSYETWAKGQNAAIEEASDLIMTYTDPLCDCDACATGREAAGIILSLLESYE